MHCVHQSRVWRVCGTLQHHKWNSITIAPLSRTAFESIEHSSCFKYLCSVAFWTGLRITQRDLKSQTCSSRRSTPDTPQVHVEVVLISCCNMKVELSTHKLLFPPTLADSIKKTKKRWTIDPSYTPELVLIDGVLSILFLQHILIDYAFNLLCPPLGTDRLPSSC